VSSFPVKELVIFTRVLCLDDIATTHYAKLKYFQMFMCIRQGILPTLPRVSSLASRHNHTLQRKQANMVIKIDYYQQQVPYLTYAPCNTQKLRNTNIYRYVRR
jgi:predicted metal-dependent hydrolase